MSYQIEKGIPAPVTHQFPLDQMDVGDSFVFEADKASALHAAVRRFTRINGGDFAVRTEGRGKRRVWRVA